ncbi:hypothetical protein PIB30_044257 [Stylosanthes scabra]|uniref:Uncharacterized protein n=1 Tax=Stylosanthes scabra TaxID=79078 RepID=A0ABU6ZEK7_9FABA|nr:hypothetical protein [Stylosanthes scabra]
MDRGYDKYKRGDQLSSQVRHSQPLPLAASVELSKTSLVKLCWCAISPKINHQPSSWYCRPQQPLNQQPEGLDLNATAHDAAASNEANIGLAGKHVAPTPTPEGERRRSTSAFDRLAPGEDNPRPFGEIGSSESQITQELRHQMQLMEQIVKELQRENTELKHGAQKSRSRSTLRRHHCSRSRSPPRRRPKTPPRQCRRGSSTSEVESSSNDSYERELRTFRRYKRTRKEPWDNTPPIVGHTPLSGRILRVQSPKGFIKPTDMKYDGSTDPHIHLNDFEHRMICDGAVDEVKCPAFPTTLTWLAGQWFSSPQQAPFRATQRFGNYS